MGDPMNSPLVVAAIRDLQTALTQPAELTRPVGRVAQDQAIVELWNLNYSMSEIGRRLGMNRGTVSNRLRRLGLS